MKKFAVVIPTNGSTPYLMSLIKNAGAPVIVVWTGPEVDIPRWLPQNAEIVVRNEGTKNIQKWWNAGIEKALDLNCDVAVFVNDDVVWAKGDAQKMADLDGAALSMLAGYNQSGWCFALDLTKGFRLDEEYQWWYGETDLLERVLRASEEVKWVARTSVQHRKFRMMENGEMCEPVRRDTELWRARHAMI